MIAETLCGLGHQQSAGRRFQRLVGIFIAARAFKYVAALHDLAAQVSGFAGDAAQLVEAVIVWLELVIRDRPIRDRHVVGNGACPIALGEHAANAEIGRQEAPVQTAPVIARTAHAFAWKERAEPADRQPEFVRRVAERDGVDRIVLHQLEPRRIAQFIAQVRQHEIIAGDVVLTALEPNHIEPGLGELARHDGAGPPHADHDGIDFLQACCHGALPTLRRNQRSTAAQPCRACRDIAR